MCGRDFAKKSNYEQHLNIVHLKMKEFQCQICEKGFSRWTMLNKKFLTLSTMRRTNKLECFSRRQDTQHDTQHNYKRRDTQHNKKERDTQHNDTQHNDTQHNDTQHKDT